MDDLRASRRGTGFTKEAAHLAESGRESKQQRTDGGEAMANRLWKMGTRRGIAYVEGRAAAERVLLASGQPPTVIIATPATVPANSRAVPEGLMAVYCDRRGKPFAWQIPFDVRVWDAVVAAVEGEGALLG